jgi:sugar lactone lactonase YvrE
VTPRGLTGAGLSHLDRTADRPDGGAIVGLRDRVALWDCSGEFRTLAIIEPDLPDNRLNECRVGPDGAFWSVRCRTIFIPMARRRG